eukprot:129384-Prymnesium_polylepis.1
MTCAPAPRSMLEGYEAPKRDVEVVETWGEVTEYGYTFNINGQLLERQGRTVRPRCHGATHALTDHLDSVQPDEVQNTATETVSLWRANTTLSTITGIFDKQPFCTWIAVQESHATKEMVDSIKTIMTPYGIELEATWGITGRGAVRAREECGGCITFYRAAAIECTKVAKPKGGRILFTLFRSKRDPTCFLPLINFYGDPPPNGDSQKITELEDTWQIFKEFTETTIREHNSVILVGDFNAEPPHVIDRRHKAVNTRKLAEKHFKDLIVDNQLKVISGFHVTHIQRTEDKEKKKKANKKEAKSKANNETVPRTTGDEESNTK